jgi:glycosyltransferase involved in cell wall biosynthesis
MCAERRKRVLIVVQNLPVPLDRRVWLEAVTLTRNDWLVSVICPKSKAYDCSFECLEKVNIYRYRIPVDAQGKVGLIAEFVWCFVATVILSFRVALRGGGFDILHICNPPETYWPLAWFWRCFGKIFIFDHHDLSPEMAEARFGYQRGLLIWALLLFERLTFQVAQVVITTNDSHRQIAIERGRKNPADVFIVRSGPDLATFKLLPPDPTLKKGKKHLVVYLGEICKQDGVDYMLRAIKILREDLGRRDFHCILVGGGPYQPAIVSYADEIGVGDLCTFTGRISDVSLCAVLSSADIAIDPDPKTSWSNKSTMNKIMEYMWFGLPIVAFDLQESRISAGEAAVFVEANQEAAMARAVADLFDSGERRTRLGHIGRQRVLNGLAWEFSVPALLAAYNRAWGLRDRPSTKARL